MRSTLRTPFGATAAVAALSLALLGCAKDETAVAADSTTTSTVVEVNAGALVEISSSATSFRYEPESKEVKVGETVTWRNIDDTKHTVTADKDQAVSFKSPTMVTDAEFVQTFAEPGTYSYFCSIHGKDKMAGSISVVE